MSRKYEYLIFIDTEFVSSKDGNQPFQVGILSYHLNDSKLVKLNEFNAKVAELYLPASGVKIDSRFCGERCSLKALFDMQMAKVVEFKDYLYMLLSKAPRG